MSTQRIIGFILIVICSLGFIEWTGEYSQISNLYSGVSFLQGAVREVKVKLLLWIGSSALGILFGAYLAFPESKYKKKIDDLITFAKDPSISLDHKNYEFSGTKDLNSDAYKIFLTKKYGVEKNEALGKIICGDKLFDNAEDALSYANDCEKVAEQNLVCPNCEASVNMNDIGCWRCSASFSGLSSWKPTHVQDEHNSKKVERIKESKETFSKTEIDHTSNVEIKSTKPTVLNADALIQPANTKIKILTYAVIVFAVIAGIVAVINSNNENEEAGAKNTTVNLAQSTSPTITYEIYKDKKLSEGWVVMPKRDEEMSPPEEKDAQYCYEGYCTVEFTNPMYVGKVLEVRFAYCIKELNTCEGGKETGTEFKSEEIISTADADKKFTEVKKQFTK